ncbi:MAG: Flp family type IVb pilin [Acidobacteriaceae bacterium]|nr:Flp family type IVb pilin [Acidobacteriaceae bacterium]
MISSGFVQFFREENGQDLVEYSLLLGFVALAAVGLLTGVRSSMQTLWTDLSNALTSAQSAVS